MLVPNKNPQGYKEHFISFISFAFGQSVTFIDFLANMKLYVSGTEESYKDKIIGNMMNSGTGDLLLHIVQFWRAWAVNEEHKSLPMVLCCSQIMYKYYYRLGFFPIKHNE